MCSDWLEWSGKYKVEKITTLLRRNIYLPSKSKRAHAQLIFLQRIRGEFADYFA